MQTTKRLCDTLFGIRISALIGYTLLKENPRIVKLFSSFCTGNYRTFVVSLTKFYHHENIGKIPV